MPLLRVLLEGRLSCRTDCNSQYLLYAKRIYRGLDGLGERYYWFVSSPSAFLGRS